VTDEDVRVGIVGVNTWHAEAFTDVLLTRGPAAHVAPVPGVRVAAVWGVPSAERHRIANLTGAREVAGSPVEMAGEVDLVLVIDDEGGGARHRELAEPFIERRVPVLVDKPMTLELADAEALFRRADELATPVMSASALRFADEIGEHRSCLAEVGDVVAIDVTGPGEWYYYGIHAVELLSALLPAGTGIAWVQRFAAERRDTAVLGLSSGSLATVSVVRDAFYTFSATVLGTGGRVDFEVTKNYEFYRNLLHAAAQMARTGAAPVGQEATMQVLRVLHAGNASLRLGKAVPLDSPGRDS
jgi:predicted dehydrogenase